MKDLFGSACSKEAVREIGERSVRSRVDIGRNESLREGVSSTLSGQRQTGENHQKRRRGIVVRRQERVDSAYHRRVTDRLNTILADETRPLRPEFVSRRIDRSGRFGVPKARTTRYKNSFILSAIQTFDQLVKRE